MGGISHVKGAYKYLWNRFFCWSPTSYHTLASNDLTKPLTVFHILLLRLSPKKWENRKIIAFGVVQ